MFCKDLSLVDYQFAQYAKHTLVSMFWALLPFSFNMCEADYTVNSFVQKILVSLCCTCWIFLPRLERHNLYFLSGSSVTKLRFAQGVYDICSPFAIFFGLNTNLQQYAMHSMHCIPLFPCFGPCRLLPTMCEADYTVNSVVQKVLIVSLCCTCWIFLPMLEGHKLYLLSSPSVAKLKFAQWGYMINAALVIFTNHINKAHHCEEIHEKH